MQQNIKVLSKIFSSKFIFQNVVQAGALVHGPHSFVDSTRVHAGEEVDHHHNHVQQHICDNFHLHPGDDFLKGGRGAGSRSRRCQPCAGGSLEGGPGRHQEAQEGAQARDQEEEDRPGGVKEH